MSKASDRHRRFAWAVFQGASYTQAYLEAGYDVDRETAAANGSRLLRNAQVQEYLDELRTKAMENQGNVLARLLDFHRQVMETAVGEIDEHHPLAQEMETKETAISGMSEGIMITRKVKSPAKMDSAREIARLLGLYAADKHELKLDELTAVMAGIRDTNKATKEDAESNETQPEGQPRS